MSIVTAFHYAEEYMLDLNSVLLEPEYIFADAASCSASLICVPILEMSERKCNYGTFFKQIMFSTRFDQMEDCGYVTRIINYLNRAGTFSMKEFGVFLTELEKTESVDFKRKEIDLMREECSAKEDNHTTLFLEYISLFYLMQHYNKEKAIQFKKRRAMQKQVQRDERQKKKEEKKEEQKDKE